MHRFVHKPPFKQSSEFYPKYLLLVLFCLHPGLRSSSTAAVVCTGNIRISRCHSILSKSASIMWRFRINTIAGITPSTHLSTIPSLRRRESDTLSPGNAITTVKTPFGVIGVGICYDMRFPELSMAMRAAGSVLLCFPGAFNMTTGPAHWELLQRARALDNQVRCMPPYPAVFAVGHRPWANVSAGTMLGRCPGCCNLGNFDAAFARIGRRACAAS